MMFNMIFHTDGCQQAIDIHGNALLTSILVNSNKLASSINSSNVKIGFQFRY